MSNRQGGKNAKKSNNTREPGIEVHRDSTSGTVAYTLSGRLGAIGNSLILALSRFL